MNEINLLHAKNVITRKTAVPEQQLSFSLLVDDLAFDKQVDVLWAGEDGAWHTLAASFHGKAAAGKEYWLARAAFPLTAERSLPGNIQFALRYRVAGAEYWDNNQGVNHSTQADSGIMLATKTAAAERRLRRTGWPMAKPRCRSSSRQTGDWQPTR
jgi:maltose 6'-phosphate phosphatase